MRQVLGLLILVGGAIALALWLAEVGGSVEIRFGETWIGVSFPIAVIALVTAFVILHSILSLIGWFRRMPARVSTRIALRRRADGDAAVTRALIALAAGAASGARAEVKRARNLLGDTPQTLLLAAEAERLAGREDAAAEAFTMLAKRDDARFLGLRGLLRQAMQREDWPEAQRLAREAEIAQPGAAWLREERQLLAARTRDWREALALAPKGAPLAPLSLAAAAQEPDADKAGALERQAFQADPGFAPAALAYASRLASQGSPRRARSTIADSWARAPHPDLGAAWIAPIEDKLGRVKAVEELIHSTREHPESRLLMARVALDAGLTGRARSELEASAAHGADRRAYLMLAELEEAEHGDGPEARAGQARWLRDAANAAPEPRWRCTNCGSEHDAWKPDCAHCSAAGTIAWSASPARITERIAPRSAA
jgi:HemY protein